MRKSNKLNEWSTDADRRTVAPTGRPAIATVPVREDDIETTKAFIRSRYFFA